MRRGTDLRRAIRGREIRASGTAIVLIEPEPDLRCGEAPIFDARFEGAKFGRAAPRLFPRPIFDAARHRSSTRDSSARNSGSGSDSGSGSNAA
jgi:hypothetical protein